MSANTNISVRVATSSSPSSRLTLNAPVGTRWPPQPSSANIICPPPPAGIIAEIAEEMREKPFMMTEFHGDRPLFVPPYRGRPERHGSLFLRTASAGRCGAACSAGGVGGRRAPSWQTTRPGR